MPTTDVLPEQVPRAAAHDVPRCSTCTCCGWRTATWTPPIDGRRSAAARGAVDPNTIFRLTLLLAYPQWGLVILTLDALVISAPILQVRLRREARSMGSVAPAGRQEVSRP